MHAAALLVRAQEETLWPRINKNEQKQAALPTPIAMWESAKSATMPCQNIRSKKHEQYTTGWATTLRLGSLTVAYVRVAVYNHTRAMIARLWFYHVLKTSEYLRKGKTTQQMR